MSNKITPPLSKEWEELRLVYRESAVGISEPVRILNGKAVLSEIPDKVAHVEIDGFTEVYLEETRYLKPNEFTVNYNNGIIYFSGSVSDGTYVVCHYRGRGVVLYPSTRIYTHYDSSTDTYTTLQGLVERMETLIGLGSGEIATPVVSVNGKTGEVTITATDIGATSQGLFNTFKLSVESSLDEINSKINSLNANLGDIDFAPLNTKIELLELGLEQVKSDILSNTDEINEYKENNDEVVRDLEIRLSNLEGRFNGFLNHIHDDRYYTKEEILALLGDWEGNQDEDDDNNPFGDGSEIILDGGTEGTTPTYILDGGELGVEGSILLDGGTLS